MTTVVVSPAADADLGAITDHYLAEAGVEVAVAFLAAWDGCVRHMTDFPTSGSPRLAAKLKLAGLRVWPLKGFPHLAVYLTGPSEVLVLRILHTSRDILSQLRE